MSLRRPLTRCLVLCAAALCAALLGSAPSRSRADVQSAIAAKQAAAQTLRGQIAADSSQISQTAGGVAAARAKLSALQAAVAAREAQLAAVQRNLIAARDHLTELENRLHLSDQALAANLLATYEGNAPDALSVLLSSHGFADLIERVDFLKTVGQQDAHIVTATRVAREQVAREAVTLGNLEIRDRALTQTVVGQRNQAAALQSALVRVEIGQLAHRSHDAAALGAIQGQISTLRAQEAAALAAARRAAAPQQSSGGGSTGGGGSGTGAVQLDSGGMVQPPPGAPAAVAQVIAAGNAIAGLPYSYGGGHASFHASAYDCSGSVSYALAAAGLVSSPLDSTGFESWGQPGPGKWITVYANAGHAFMVVAGWRFDTVALSEGGTRWSQSMTDTSAFVARHPAGL